MTWKKIKTNSGEMYVLSDTENVLHYTKDISLAELNDPTKDFEFVKNPEYLFETKEVTGDELPAGVYSLRADDIFDEPKLYPISPTHDAHLFELDVVKDVLKSFRAFLDAKDIYKESGNVYKHGVLLYGPPGTGKTTSIQMIVNKIRPENSIVIYIPKELPGQFINALKEDKRLKILIFEELTMALERASSISRLLTFLDGENSVDNTYVIATTNYPESLPGNILREGRFDELYRIDGPTLKDRKIYLEHLLGRKPTVAEVQATCGMTISQIKTLVLTMKRYKISIKEAESKSKLHSSVIKKNFKKTQNLGFDQDDD